jgi:hypothetical protein
MLYDISQHWSHTNSLSLANFVGSVVGFLNVCKIRLRRLLLAASLSFESNGINQDFTVNAIILLTSKRAFPILPPVKSKFVKNFH